MLDISIDILIIRVSIMSDEVIFYFLLEENFSKP